MYKITYLLICVIFAAITTTSFVQPDIVIGDDANTTICSQIEQENSSELYLQNKAVEPCEIELLSVLVMAEAEDEPEEGKYLVIDTVLNRVDSDRYPNNIYDVIYQKNQFTSVWNGRFDKCDINTDVCGMVIEELRCRTNNDCIYFNADHYSDYGIPMFCIGRHYFSSEGDD